MSDDWPIFEPPDQDQLARRADDLRHRAALVRRYGWDQYRSRWSTVFGGIPVEQHGVAVRR
jgi:hypothetical protein